MLRLAQRYMVDPLHINLSPDKVTVENIRQSYITVDEDRKFELLLHVIEREEPRQCIIFCERKRWADDLYRELRQQRKRVAVMHGDLPQPMRNRIMQGFRDGKIIYLVATDVVGRGIDVTNISHVINYDLPDDPENYVHRIGRTGRIGADGVAIAFVTPEQGEQLTDIEAFINKMIDEDRIEGFEAYIRRAPPPQVGRSRPSRWCRSSAGGRDVIAIACKSATSDCRGEHASPRQSTLPNLTGDAGPPRKEALLNYRSSGFNALPGSERR